MKIKDIKAGGWIRFTSDDVAELAKIQKFDYDKTYTNGYCFYLDGRDCGLLFERKEFEYSDNVADLIKKGESVVVLENHYLICNFFTKDEFIKSLEVINETEN